MKLPHHRLLTPLLLTCALLLGLPAVAAAQDEAMEDVESTGFGGSESTSAEDADASGSFASEHLHSLLDEEWQKRLGDDPLLATEVGSRQGIDRLPSVSIDALEARAEADRGFLECLRAIDRSALGDVDRVSYDVFAWQLETRIRGVEVASYRFPITADSGFHTGLARLATWVPLETPEDYRAYIARLRQIPRYVGEHLALMRDGLEHGFTLPRVVLEGYEVTIASHVVEKAEDSVFYAPFAAFPVGVPEKERAGLEKAGREAVIEGAVAGFEDFLEFFLDEYRPAARASLGASAMPGGETYYQSRVERYTTLEMTAQEVHDLGLAEVARIRSEMDAILERVEWSGDFAGFLEFLRTDPRFYAETGEELLEEAAYIAKRMDGQLPKLFRRYPRQPYGVEPVPDYLAPKYTAGRYVPAPLESTRGGTYWVNTYALETRPLYALEALTLHEAVPGHHFQGALSQELDVPPFRRHLYISAFGEGWGLYSERLGREVGFYTDPYSDFGRLTYEMWRACRLVVDTGIHAFGWSRQQALDYLASNTALSLHEVTTEIDRYIAWPGQALAYKIGELKIRELRRRAEETLGSSFDLRAFHDRVLSSGAVPLPVLETEIDRWITEQGAAKGES